MMFLVYVKNLKDPEKPHPQLLPEAVVNGNGSRKDNDNILAKYEIPREDWLLPFFQLVQKYPYKGGSDVEPIPKEE